jgi:outer membrane protein OmpA-like peptidoglycan-associated protein
MLRILFLLLFAGACWASKVAGQITINTRLSPEKAVKEVLVGEGIIVSNVRSSLAPEAYGKFTTPSNFLGIDSGIVLTTGQTYNIQGPNSYPPNTSGSINQYPGDPDLDKLLGGRARTLDASILQFDFLALSDTLRFRYVFASEEYPEFAPSAARPKGSAYNDVFGFFLSGPGIDSVVNIARIPGTGQPVSVKTINKLYNSQYYRSNEVLNGPAYAHLEYNGYTAVLVAEYYPLIPCQTYHIKLAIADVGDGELDSSVFIEAKSFRTTPAPTLKAIGNSQKNKQWYIHEGCHSGFFELQNASQIARPATFRFQIGGSAALGKDYTLIPAPQGQEVILAQRPGKSAPKIEVLPIYRPGVQGKRSIILQAVQSGCDNLIPPDTLWLVDTEPLTLSVNGARAAQKGQKVRLEAKTNGGSGLQTIFWPKGVTGESWETIFNQDTAFVIIAKDKCAGLPEAQQKVEVRLGLAPKGSVKPAETLAAPDYLPLSVYFAFNKTEMDSAVIPVLDHLADYLKKNPKAQIKIIGYTDSKGGVAYNNRLSLARAQTVQTFLQKRGVNPKQMQAIGLGEKVDGVSSTVPLETLSEDRQDSSRRKVTIEWKN